jgi:hypothetical protein
MNRLFINFSANCYIHLIYEITIMRKSLLFVLSTIMILACSTSKKSTVGKWTPLFNGKNLDGWTIKISGQPIGVNHLNTFVVEDGILKIKYDNYKTFDNQFGGLYTKKAYTNYRFKAEYRFVGETTPGAPSWGYRDSGVQFHCQDPASLDLKQNFPICLEYNLHGGNGKDDRPVGEICLTGTLVDIQGKPSKGCNPALIKRTIHGDQWATLEIDVQGDHIKQYINGEEIIAYDNPRFDPNHEKGKTFIKNGVANLNSGFISLQSNSHPIQFRKIEIMEY